jgi:FMN-dependent NADH-azoreductase
MKTLVVKYLPRGEASNTKRLLDAFLQQARPAQLETLDLTIYQPEFFGPESLGAYIHRNYFGQPLTPSEAESIASMDRMVKQFKSAGVVVMATPMFNFSVPGAIKTYFDCIMMKDETWEIRDGAYAGLMQGRRAVALVTTGGIYEGMWASYDLATPLLKTEFDFMGFDEVQIIMAQGLNAKPAEAPDILARAEEQARALAKRWYG